ncbi:hypothetical protein ACFL0F_02515, partial [Patescibacteria group bacterium]
MYKIKKLILSIVFSFVLIFNSSVVPLSVLAQEGNEAPQEEASEEVTLTPTLTAIPPSSEEEKSEVESGIDEVADEDVEVIDEERSGDNLGGEESVIGETIDELLSEGTIEEPSVSEESARLIPSVGTDKDDYAPTEVVTITGSAFPVNSDLMIRVTWPDGLIRNSEGEVNLNDSVTTDENGSFIFFYDLRGEGQDGEYLAEILIGTAVLASVTFTDGTDKVTICHATSSHSNPYIENQPSKSGDVSGHDNHNGPIWYPGITVTWGDIIPPFDYDGGSYPGKNWTIEGQAIWNNGCNIPGQPLSCGNGTLDDEEECDYGANNGDSACTNECTLNETPPLCEPIGLIDPLDQIDLGDSGSESLHTAYGWGDDPGSGNYGGRDGEQTFSLVVGSDECDENGKSAGFTFDVGGNYADKLTIRHLDGLSNLDSFDVFVNGSFWAHYTDSQDSDEVWKTSEFPLPNLSGVISVEIVLTDEIWPSCSTWGQLAINWVRISGYECEGEPFCGNGVINGDEQCDFGVNNGASGSACSESCTWSGVQESCQEGNYVDFENPIEVDIDGTNGNPYSKANWDLATGSKEDSTYGNWDGHKEIGMVVGPGQCTSDTEAEFIIGETDTYITELQIRSLDGISGTDSFDILLNGVFLAHYSDNGVGGELWDTLTYPVPGLSGYGVEGPVTVKFISTDLPAWDGCNQWGQVAVNWVNADGYYCEEP